MTHIVIIAIVTTVLSALHLIVRWIVKCYAEVPMAKDTAFSSVFWRRQITP